MMDDEQRIVYVNHTKTAMVNESELSDGTPVYDVYSMGSENEIEEADIAERAVCFTCRNKAKAVALAAFIDNCCV